jgi:hypothetical protein
MIIEDMFYNPNLKNDVPASYVRDLERSKETNPNIMLNNGKYPWEKQTRKQS